MNVIITNYDDLSFSMYIYWMQKLYYTPYPSRYHCIVSDAAIACPSELHWQSTAMALLNNMLLMKVSMTEGKRVPLFISCISHGVHLLQSVSSQIGCTTARPSGIQRFVTTAANDIHCKLHRDVWTFDVLEIWRVQAEINDRSNRMHEMTVKVI
jgi:hypothetical protein